MEPATAAFTCVPSASERTRTTNAHKKGPTDYRCQCKASLLPLPRRPDDYTHFSGLRSSPAALKSIGLRGSLGIDSVLYKVRLGPVIKLDLLQPGAQKLLFSILDSQRLLFVWLSPPNGSAPETPAIKQPHVEGNFPEENDEFNFKDPSAGDSDQEDKIAHLQDLSCVICVYLSQAGKPWSVACSTVSNLWSTQAWQAVVELCQPTYSCFQTCMYGGPRPKRMTLAFANIPELSYINLLCDGSHEHDMGGWSRSAPNASSAFDSPYPRKLCAAVAAAVHANCIARGIQDIPSDLQSVPGDIAMDEVAARAMAGSSAAQRRLPGLMPEYRVKLTVTLRLSEITWQVKDRTQHFLRVGDVLIPPKSRLLAIIPTTNGDVDARQCIFGVPWKPQP